MVLLDLEYHAFAALILLRNKIWKVCYVDLDSQFWISDPHRHVFNMTIPRAVWDRPPFP
jgi:hypothetical protein